MKESYFFKPIKERVEKKKESAGMQPITAEDHEEAEQGPMNLKDHWLSLRQSIQEKLAIEKPTEDEQERIKLLSELITPELMIEYRQIIKGFREKTKKSEGHLQREFVDISSEDISINIENWINNLIAEIQNNKKIDFNRIDTEELEAQCWLFFDSVGIVMNTKTVERDIIDFYENKKLEELDEKEQEKQKTELIRDLQNRYPLDESEIKILVNLITAENGEGEKYSPKILVETIAKLWNEYKLGDKKRGVAKISLGYLMSKGAESFAPSLFQNMIVGDKFNVAVFLEFFGLNKISGIIDVKTDIELAKTMNDVNYQINERISNSLFFQEFEFIHNKSLGEIYSILERGKISTKQLLSDTISEFIPTLSGIGMSLAFLTKINPALGAMGLGSLPVMYRVAKKQNEKIWPMYEKEKRESEKIATHIGSIKNGFEEVKTSPDTPSIASHVKEQMNIKDALSLQRFIEETKNSLKRMIPFDVSTIAAAGIGGALQEMGMISGGAVLSNIIYSDRLNRPVQELVNLYFNKFSRYIQDIQRMDEILGKYEKLDLPEGEKEKARTSVSELENFDISIKNLGYKNILRDVNINIKQGEFLTIAGVSGVGKSTLLRNLVGLYKSDRGSINIGGVKNEKIKKYGKESIYSVMSYCNQNPQFFSEMTLRENLLLWSKNKIDDKKIKGILKDLHLDKFADKLDKEVVHLSGGEKVRIGVARTLIKGAKIMLLDEPTASLDSQSATEVRKIIVELSEKYSDLTIIAVSHDEELIKASKRSIDLAELQK